MPKLITDAKLKELLAASPAERVTEEGMKARIATVAFTRIGETLTHCTITLDNGYVSTGESACVNAENYKKEIGEKLAYDTAFRKLWALFGFLLAERNFIVKNHVKSA